MAPNKFPTSQKRITLEEIKSLYRITEYPALAALIKTLLEENRIKPVIASRTNGKTPALYNAYHIIRERKDYSGLIGEMKFHLSPLLDNAYYLKNPEKYIQDRNMVLQLSQYLTECRDSLDTPVSINERSFEIWGREKYLGREGGMNLLKNLKFDVKRLNIYATAEPVAYYSHHKSTPQNIVIIENKDTFYSMRRYMAAGNATVLGVPVGTLIYGGGKGINKSMLELEAGVEPYIYEAGNRMLYFGDLDYEGILIYENLEKALDGKYDLQPFKTAYEAMLDKALEKPLSSLPDTKEGQNRNLNGSFFESFSEKNQNQMKELLEAGKYIPQEILNIRDFGQIYQDRRPNGI